MIAIRKMLDFQQRVPQHLGLFKISEAKTYHLSCAEENVNLLPAEFHDEKAMPAIKSVCSMIMANQHLVQSIAQLQADGSVIITIGVIQIPKGAEK